MRQCVSDSSFSAELFSSINQPPFQPQAGQGHPQKLSLWERLISTSVSWTMAGRGAKMCYWQHTEGRGERWGATPQTYFCIKNRVSLSAFNYSGAALPPGTGKPDPRSQKVVEEKKPLALLTKKQHMAVWVHTGVMEDVHSGSLGRHCSWKRRSNTQVCSYIHVSFQS